MRGTEAAIKDERSSTVEYSDSTPKTSVESPSVTKNSGCDDVDIEEDPAKPSDKMEPNVLHSPQIEDMHHLSSSLPAETNTSLAASSIDSTTVTKTTTCESSSVNKPTPPQIMSVGEELGLLPDVVHGGGGGGDGGGGWGGWGEWGNSLWSSVSIVAESAQAIGQKVN